MKNVFIAALQMLYQIDVLEGDTLISWHKSPQWRTNKYDENTLALHAAVCRRPTPFLTKRRRAAALTAEHVDVQHAVQSFQAKPLIAKLIELEAQEDDSDEEDEEEEETSEEEEEETSEDSEESDETSEDDEDSEAEEEDESDDDD